MKKIINVISALILSTLLLVSCGEKDDEKKLTPQQQFTTTIQKSISGNAKTVTNGLLTAYKEIDLTNYGDELAISFKLGDSFAALLHSYLEENLGNISTSWCKSAQVGLKTQIVGNSIKLDVTAGVNDTNIISANIVEDTNSSTVYISIPELIKKTFKVSGNDFGISFSNYYTQYFAYLSFLSTIPDEAVFTTCIDEILSAITTPVTNIERSKEIISAGMNNGKSVSAEYTALSTVIDSELGEKIAKAAYSAIKTNNSLNTILNWFIPEIAMLSGESIRVKDVTSELAEAVADAINDAFLYGKVKLTFYVDKQSKLAGTRITMLNSYDDEKEGEFFIAMPQKGSEFGYLCSFDDTTETVNLVSGYGSYSGGKMTGDFVVSSPENEQLVAFETKNLNLTDLKSFKFNGTVTVHPAETIRQVIQEELTYEVDSSLASIASVFDFSITAEQKDYKSIKADIMLSVENEPYATLTVKSSMNKPAPFSVPTTDIILVDEDIAEHLDIIASSISTQTIAQNLKTAKVPDEYVQQVSSIDGNTLMEYVEDEFYY